MPRLFDLVRFKDDKLKTAFYFALRDTLVVGNLEQATRIAYGKTRYRVVTETGQLIEMSGAVEFYILFDLKNTALGERITF